jgi:hypothetical protein
VVDEAVRDAGVLRDVADARRMEPFAREHAHRGLEDDSTFLLGRRHRQILESAGRHRAAADMASDS